MAAGGPAAEGDWLWLAEADDEAEPGLLAALAGAAAGVPGSSLPFATAAVSTARVARSPSYREYLVESGAAALTQGCVFPAREFARRFLAERNLILNASAVLWRRESLLAALERAARSSIAGGSPATGGSTSGARDSDGEGRRGGVAAQRASPTRAGVSASLAAKRHIDEVAPRAGGGTLPARTDRRKLSTASRLSPPAVRDLGTAPAGTPPPFFFFFYFLRRGGRSRGQPACFTGPFR